MAITTTLVTSNYDGWDTATETGFVTASITPGANCALVLLIAAVDGFVDGAGDLFSATATAHSVVSSGSGPTWTKQTSSGISGTFNYHSVVWTAVIGGSDPGSFTVTVDYQGGEISGAYAYSI